MPNEFLEKRVLTKEIKNFGTISKNTDKSLNVGKVLVHQKAPTTVEVNRNILEILFSNSMKTENKIDFKKKMKYPLSVVATPMRT